LNESATYDFDDPGDERQDVPGNSPAKKDTMEKSAAMIDSFAKPMPDAGRTHGPPATKKAGGSHHRQGR
jgi:hypothetical protein